MEDNFLLWNVPDLWRNIVLTFAALQEFLVYLWFWLIQHILTEQGRSFIKGLGNKDSIELLRHDDFFPYVGGCILRLSHLLPLYYCQDNKPKWKLCKDCFIISRIGTVFLCYSWFLTILSIRLINIIEFK